MLLQKRRTLPQRILRQIRIETHQSQRRKTDQSGNCNKARCKRVVVVAVGNCTREMCVRARRCLCSSTDPRALRRNAYIYQASSHDEVGFWFLLFALYLVLFFSRYNQFEVLLVHILTPLAVFR